jgi:hypothetical protein
MEERRLLTEAEVSEIREGVRKGIRGPVMLKWVEQLMNERDFRIAQQEAEQQD